MRLANRIAEETSWKDAVDHVAPDAALREYIRDPRRASFQCLWDIPPDSTVLDVGAGWGAIADGLARSFSRVVAVEGVLERCRFIRTRMRQIGHNNVDVICANFLGLPLPSGQFDAVVLNGVLEWIGLASKEGDPRDLQLTFLRRVHELLKPGGILCVGIENRIGWACWLGAKDHSGLRYTSLMPRTIANLVCRVRSRGYRSSVNRSYRTYTYSLPGYRRLFRQAGFAQVAAYHPWHGYNNPTVLLSLDGDSGALSHFVSRQNLNGSLRGRVKSAAMKIAARSGLWRHLASDYVFVTQRA